MYLALAEAGKQQRMSDVHRKLAATHLNPVHFPGVFAGRIKEPIPLICLTLLTKIPFLQRHPLVLCQACFDKCDSDYPVSIQRRQAW